MKRYVNGGATLAPGVEITRDMALAALTAQSMTEDVIGEGDVVLFVTGWEEHWGDGTLVYYAGAPGIPGGVPGIGLEVAMWLASKRSRAWVRTTGGSKSFRTRARRRKV